MTTESLGTAKSINLNDNWLFKAGGLAAYATGILYLVGLVLFIFAGKLPTTGAAWLSFVNQKSGIWSGIILITLGIDILFLLVNVTLYVALRPANRGLALLAAVWACAANLLIEATTNINYGAMLTLGSHYTSAGTAAERAANVAAADYANGALTSWLATLYSLGLPSLAVLLFGILMLRSRFGKRIAYLGIAAGAFGMIAVSGWDLAVLLNSVLEGVWLIFVGRTLYFRYTTPVPLVPEPSPEEAVSVAP